MHFRSMSSTNPMRFMRKEPIQLNAHDGARAFAALLHRENPDLSLDRCLEYATEQVRSHLRSCWSLLMISGYWRNILDPTSPNRAGCPSSASNMYRLAFGIAVLTLLALIPPGTIYYFSIGDDAFQATMKAQNVSEAQETGVLRNACTTADWYRRGFKGTKNGRAVRGHLCKGLFTSDIDVWYVD